MNCEAAKIIKYPISVVLISSVLPKIQNCRATRGGHVERISERTSRPMWVWVFNDNDLKGLTLVYENSFRSKGYR